MEQRDNTDSTLPPYGWASRTCVDDIEDMQRSSQLWVASYSLPKKELMMESNGSDRLMSSLLSSSVVIVEAVYS